MTLLIPVAVLGATGAAVYLLSLRPLPQARRGDGRGGVGRGPAAGAGVDLDAQLRDAGAELARLRRARSATGGTAVSSAGAVRTGVQRPPNVDHGWESGLVGSGAAAPAAVFTGPPAGADLGATGSRAAAPGPGASPWWRRYLPMNVSGPERVVRGAVGVALAVALVVLGPGAVGEDWGTALLVLAWVAVADLMISGLIGHCPLHRWVRLPWDPRRRR